MEITYEDKPGGMQRIYFHFCRELPAPEDAWVRRGLANGPVPPKRTFTEEREGKTYDILQWGLCVIGEAMYDIEKHQGLVRLVEQDCAAELDGAALDAPERNRLISELAIEFHGEARMSYDESTQFEGVDVDRGRMRERLLERLAGTPAAG